MRNLDAIRIRAQQITKAKEKRQKEAAREPRPNPAPATRASRKLDSASVKRKEATSWKPPPPLVATHSKRRDKMLSVSLSAEERQIIRKYMSDHRHSFSKWVREILFRDMGVPIPPRKVRQNPED